MPSSSETRSRIDTALMVRLALLASGGLLLHLVEGLIPQPLPWARIGLANVVTLMALVMYGERSALVVVLIRVVLGALVGGTLLNPGFVIALGGGLTSVAAMGAAYRLHPRVFSLVGVSIWGALSHNATQLALVYGMLVRRAELFYLAPFFILSSVVAGGLMGLVASLLLDRVGRACGVVGMRM